HQGGILGATFAADGRAVATWAADGRVRVWTMRRSPPLRLDGPEVESVAWSADGTRIAASGFDRVCRVHDAATGEVVASFRPGDEFAVACLDFSPDGKFVVTGSKA